MIEDILFVQRNVENRSTLVWQNTAGGWWRSGETEIGTTHGASSGGQKSSAFATQSRQGL